jgi:hypothetical protein
MCAVRASVTSRSVGIARWRMNAKAPGVCEPSSIFIKGGLGTISSSRCQTTRARPGEPGRARIFSSFWTSSARGSKAGRHGLRSRHGIARHGIAADRQSANLRPPIWWSQTGSNRRPPACKAGALPTELWPPSGISNQVSGIKKKTSDT